MIFSQANIGDLIIRAHWQDPKIITGVGDGKFLGKRPDSYEDVFINDGQYEILKKAENGLSYISYPDQWKIFNLLLPFHGEHGDESEGAVRIIQRLLIELKGRRAGKW